MAAGEGAETIVIGAGIVGLMAARALLKDGRRVTVLERGEPGHGASFGNAGVLAFPEVLPLASMDSLKQAPKWLFDPLGPLSVRPAYALKIAPWLFRFFRSAARPSYDAALAAQSRLMRLAETEMDTALTETGLSGFVKRVGALDLFESEAAFRAARHEWTLRGQAGFEGRPLTGAELAEAQPGLNPRFTHGMLFEKGRQVQNPYEFTAALAQWLTGQGVSIRKGEVTRIETQDGKRGATVILDGGERIAASALVIAAGAWSKPLAAGLGDTLPLDTERGYNTTLPRPHFVLKRQLYFGGHGFVASPLADGAVRIGGAVEFAGLDLPPNFARSEAMVKRAKIFLPGLSDEGGTQWMGFRPSMPDSLPVIGSSRASRDIVYAFGHGHLGLTQSAGTGRLVADLLTGREPAIDVSPFQPGRFSKSS